MNENGTPIDLDCSPNLLPPPKMSGREKPDRP
jgi:hypothetical protein